MLDNLVVGVVALGIGILAGWGLRSAGVKGQPATGIVVVLVVGLTLLLRAVVG